jgi:hypothetical protein
MAVPLPLPLPPFTLFQQLRFLYSIANNRMPTALDENATQELRSSVALVGHSSEAAQSALGGTRRMANKPAH